MMEMNRRDFLYYSAKSGPLLLAPGAITWATENLSKKLPTTKEILSSAYVSEYTASKRYIEFSKKASKEKYINIAYTFTAFSVSEWTHAEGFKKVLKEIGFDPKVPALNFKVRETKLNMQTASKKELSKIEKGYPDFLQRLTTESHEPAILNCMYALKSHKQHKAEIQKIARFVKPLFGLVSNTIEKMDLHYHVCRICGSTLDHKPEAPCEICNLPRKHYLKIERPV